MPQLRRSGSDRPSHGIGWGERGDSVREGYARIQAGAAICANEQAVYQGLPNRRAVDCGNGQNSGGDASANTIERVLKGGHSGDCQQLGFQRLDRRIQIDEGRGDQPSDVMDRMRQRVRHAGAIAQHFAGVAEGDDSGQQGAAAAIRRCGMRSRAGAGGRRGRRRTPSVPGWRRKDAIGILHARKASGAVRTTLRNNRGEW